MSGPENQRTENCLTLQISLTEKCLDWELSGYRIICVQFVHCGLTSRLLDRLFSCTNLQKKKKKKTQQNCNQLSYFINNLINFFCCSSIAEIFKHCSNCVFTVLSMFVYYLPINKTFKQKSPNHLNMIGTWPVVPKEPWTDTLYTQQPLISLQSALNCLIDILFADYHNYPWLRIKAFFVYSFPALLKAIRFTGLNLDRNAILLPRATGRNARKVRWSY